MTFSFLRSAVSVMPARCLLPERLRNAGADLMVPLTRPAGAVAPKSSRFSGRRETNTPPMVWSDASQPPLGDRILFDSPVTRSGKSGAGESEFASVYDVLDLISESSRVTPSGTTEGETL